MKLHVKKIVPLLTTTLLVAVTHLSARDVDCSGFGCNTPTCATNQDCGWNFYADVLYWKARGSNITYCADYFNGEKKESSIAGEIIPGGIQTDALFNSYGKVKRTKNKSLRFKDDLGFRLGLAYMQPCSDWDFGINWTHFNTKAFGKESKCKPGVLCEVEQFFKYRNRTEWNLHLNYGDIEAGREFCVDDRLALKLLAGVRWASICQDYDTHAKFEFESFDQVIIPDILLSNIEIFVQNDETAFVDIFKIDETHDFVGAGPKIGLDLEWKVNCGWSVFGSAAFSYLFGYSNHHVSDCVLPLREKGVQNDGIITVPQQIIDIRETEIIATDDRTYERDLNLQGNRPMTDLAVGIRYVPMMNCCPYLISFQLSFEHHAIFGQKHAAFNDLQTPLRNCGSTLAVYGMAFSANLSF